MSGLVKLSVVIPTLNVAKTLSATINSLEEGKAVFDFEIIIVDCGSVDETQNIAESLGLKVITAPKGRGQQMAAGVASSRGEWLMFLHADTLLEAGWAKEVSAFIKQPNARSLGAYFKFSLNDDHPKAIRMADIVAWRARVFGLPYGDQGFFISRQLLNDIGGVKPIPLMEDVDLVRRVGRKNLYAFKTKAITSAIRYLKGGYYRRASLHLLCLSLYFIGVPIKYIVKVYG